MGWRPARVEPPLPSGFGPFRSGERSFGGVTAHVAASAVAAASDVAVVLDAKGIVRDVAFGSAEMQGAGLGDWVERPWIDTVSPDSRGKVEDMLRGGAARWRQINHPGTIGEVPVRYLALGADDGRHIVVGRDLRATAALQQRLLVAQQTMERDYLRLRQAEGRYRVLFDLSSEAVLVIDSVRRRIVEANAAARRLAGSDDNAMVGQSFAAIIHPDDREAAIALLGAVAAAEQAPARVRLVSSDTHFELSASLFRQDRATFFLARLAPVDLEVPLGDPERLLLGVVERLPDAFAVTDEALRVLAHNAAFLDLVQIARPDEVMGASLSRWIGRPGIDLALMAAQLGEHGSLRNFATIARGRHGGQEEIEVAAVCAPDGERTAFGFAMRTVSRRPREAPAARDVPRSMDELTELVGRVPLKEIVRESTDLIERLCIEAALTYTSDNRASAAEILGLSRQSLYAKLHRHGLGNLAEAD